MAHSKGLTCIELVELVTEYLENSLPAAERARFEAHLALCPGCVTYLEQMRLTIRILGRLSEDSLDEPTRDMLLLLFRDWKRSGSSP